MARTKQSLKRRSKAHRAGALKLRARHNRKKGERRRHRNRQVRKKGGKNKK